MMEFLNEIGGLIAVLAFAISLAGLLYTFRRDALKDLKAELDNPIDRADLLNDQPITAGNAYFDGLARVTAWADAFYGKRKLGWPAFNRCLTLAFLYPLLAILLAWVIANVHSPGGLAVFQDTPQTWGRIWRGALMVALFVAVYTYMKNLERIEARIKGFLTSKVFHLTNPDGFLSKASGFVSELVAFAFAVAGAGAFAGAVAGAGAGAVAVAGAFAVAVAGAVAVAVAVAVAFAVAVAGAVAVAVAVAVAGAVAVAVAVAVAGETELAAIFLFFYILLPIANAVSDFLSVAATRSFLGYVKTRRPGLTKIVLLMGIDMIVGLLCLGVLLTLLVQGLDLWERLSPDTLPLDRRSYWQTVCNDPWQGVALWLMAFTTLLPTLVHVVFGLAAVVTYKSRLNARALRDLAEYHAADDMTPNRARTIASTLLRAKAYGLCLSALLIFLALALLWMGGQALLVDVIGEVIPQLLS